MQLTLNEAPVFCIEIKISRSAIISHVLSFDAKKDEFNIVRSRKMIMLRYYLYPIRPLIRMDTKPKVIEIYVKHPYFVLKLKFLGLQSSAMYFLLMQKRMNSILCAPVK